MNRRCSLALTSTFLQLIRDHFVNKTTLPFTRQTDKHTTSTLHYELEDFMRDIERGYIWIEYLSVGNIQNIMDPTAHEVQIHMNSFHKPDHLMTRCRISIYYSMHKDTNDPDLYLMTRVKRLAWVLRNESATNETS